MEDKLFKVVGDPMALSRQQLRDKIMDFEDLLSVQAGAFFGDSSQCPLTHKFSDSIYLREIFIPKGTYLVGKIHKYSHPVFIMSGTIEVITEEHGCQILTGPTYLISPPGTKRAGRAITDVYWVTVHYNPTNTQDLKELEKLVIAESYESYDKFLEKKESRVVKFLRRIIKNVQLKLTGS